MDNCNSIKEYILVIKSHQNYVETAVGTTKPLTVLCNRGPYQTMTFMLEMVYIQLYLMGINSNYIIHLFGLSFL